MPGQQNCQQENDAGGERLREPAGFAYDTNIVEIWISQDIDIPNSTTDKISDVRLDGATRKRLR